MLSNIISYITSVKIVFFAILLVSSSFISAQVEKSETEAIEDNADLIFDSLITDLNDASIDTIRVTVLNEIAWHYAPTNFQKSITYADSALELSRKIGWLRGEAFALKHKGEAFRYNGEFEKSLLNHEVSLSIFEKIDDQYNVGSLLSNIGISYHQSSEYLRAYEYYDKALDIFLKFDNKIGIQKINIYLGLLFNNLKDHDKAIEKFNYALKYATELDDNSSKASILGNIGVVYYAKENYSEALKYYKRALEIYRHLNDTYNYSIILGNIGNLHTEQHNFIQALHYNDLALVYSNKIGNKLQSAVQIGNKGRIKFYLAKEEKSNINLAKYRELLGDAEQNLITSIDLLSILGDKDKELFYLTTLIDVHKEKNNFVGALASMEQVQALKDSIYSSTTNKKIAEMGVQQDLKLQEKEIELLNKENEYQRLVKSILIFLAILLVFLSLFMIYLDKKNKKRNKLLEENIEIRKLAEDSLKKNEKELNKHKNNLEMLVKQRTNELESEVAERKRTEEDLLVAIDRVEAANRAKSIFLENMSHELRTPLVGILGYSGLLTSEVPSKELKEMADGINRTGNRLLNTLSMVLDLARIESDKFEININDVDIKEELQVIYNNFKGAVAIKNIDFTLNVSDEISKVYTDSGMFKVVVENLVNNAIKFTKKGSIKLEAEMQGNGKGKYLIVNVIDTGIGIRKNEIPIIFKEFKQLSEGTLKDFQGTGLGLSISKKFTEHLDGELIVESEFGIGSKFTVKLPV